MNSDSAIFCFGEENINSYEENEKCKDGAKIQFCAIFALCAKTAQDYLRKFTVHAALASFFYGTVFKPVTQSLIYLGSSHCNEQPSDDM